MNYLHKLKIITDSVSLWISALPYPLCEWYFLGVLFLILLLLDILLIIKIRGKGKLDKTKRGSKKFADKTEEDKKTAEQEKPDDRACKEITDLASLKAAINSESLNLSYEDICSYEADIYKEMLGVSKKAGEGNTDEADGKNGVVSTIIDGINTKEDEESYETECEMKKNREKEKRLKIIDESFNDKIPKSISGNTVDDIDI